MAARNGISGVAVAAMFGGAVLAYSGVKGKGISATLRGLIAGKNPSDLPTTQAIVTPAEASTIPTYTGEHSGGAPVIGGTNAQASIARFLVNDLHLTRAGAAAVLGNLQIESGFNTTTLGDNGTSIGIAQWRLGRRQALQAYARSVGGKETDLSVQLGYLRKELQESYPGVLHELQTTNDAASAAANFDKNFEGSTGAARGKRVSAAQRFMLIIQQLLGG